MANFNRQLLVTYEKVYGENLPADHVGISAINKITWAKIIARLNHVARTRSEYAPIDVFSDWFNSENHAAANEIWDKLKASYNKLGVRANDLHILNVWSNLTLLDEVLSTEIPENSGMSNSESEVLAFELYLDANQKAAQRTDRIFDQIKEQDHPNIVDRFARIGLTLLYPYHDLNHFNPVELLISQFTKSFYCLQFFREDYPDLLTKFLTVYGVQTWQGYLKGILPIAHMAAIPGNDTGLNYLKLNESTDMVSNKKFLDHLALTNDDEYPLRTDFIHARSHPLFKVDEDEYLILDSVLTVYRIFNSMFFELLRISEKHSSLNLKGKFFSVFTFEFIEKYLCYSLLDRIFAESKFIHFQGSEIEKKFKLGTEPDYYARNGNKIFLFEIKGSIVTGPAKQSFTYEDIETELKEKFLLDTSDGKNKAVKQLAERIKILLERSERSAYDKGYNPKNVRFFPILLVSELMLTTPGINQILNKWFWEEVENYNVLKCARQRINDLVIIDIDTLIIFSKEFEENPRLLEKLILDYNYACSKDRVESIKRKQGVTQDMLEQRIWSTLDSFGFFIRRKMKPRIPDIFKKFAQDLFKSEEIDTTEPLSPGGLYRSKEV
ncbi:MAG TPA: hypothetical protein VGE44_00350 [Daejeonella sp.]|uniref:hypothetical protein n=1 Tax=Daejeonella sp. TaxID=2805397 RepID=UPI002EDAEB01